MSFVVQLTEVTLVQIPCTVPASCILSCSTLHPHSLSLISTTFGCGSTSCSCSLDISRRCDDNYALILLFHVLSGLACFVYPSPNMPYREIPATWCCHHHHCVFVLCFVFFLLQVCRKLGVIEVDYFGLQFSGSKGENLWLNLRNRISQQMDSVTPCRLRLRVKFFVEPHLILQEQTRYFWHRGKCLNTHTTRVLTCL